ncbi:MULTISPECIES: hypothetical protein [unclassified Coleofasciculus]|uniref:hypothetical protein n=1 Tax=unclassified Coleofasciculus TaxID=2692782 RepID=UPI00187FEB4F|nr:MULTISPECIES: hypothetical protein [unclassified Coleofasciculus]MBE9128594.1 hypothetical protein [Coleofasciculus sp. LEGE 07081]MBE9150684.1 hypothetical protein [Coleofasciculus sp. LEGE 07092]
MNAERIALSDAVRVSVSRGEGCRSMEKIATEVPIELKVGKVLKIILFEKNYYITNFEGLKVIETSLNWLQDISPRKLRSLKKFGFTGESKFIIYKNKIGYFKKEARSFEEWVAVWTYFASMGNTKAAEILRLLTLKNLGDRIKASVVPDFDT